MTPDRAVPVAPAVDDPGGSAAPPPVVELSVLARCRLVLRTWPRRFLLALTLGGGALAAAAVVVGGVSVEERTFAAVAGPVQSLMSVTVPFLGVLLVQDLQRPSSRTGLVTAVLAALVVAVLVALFGLALCGSITALTYSRSQHGGWEHVGTIVVGSLLVQVLAQLTGTGFGLLVRRPAVACLLTVVPLLGIWSLLGALDVLRPAQSWLTPYATARNLLAGDMTAVHWAQWLLVFALWGIGLNILGCRRATAPRTAR